MPKELICNGVNFYELLTQFYKDFNILSMQKEIHIIESLFIIALMSPLSYKQHRN